MIKWLFLISLLFILGCGEFPKYRNNQVLRREIFLECLDRVPRGPTHTKYNDWAEVISECENAAYKQSRECYENCWGKKEEK